MSDANASPTPNATPKAKSKIPLTARLKKVMALLVHPMTIGAYLTLSFAILTFNYYQKRIDIRSAGKFFQIVSDIDQKTIDWRLWFRGPRPVSPDVAVLAVDDASLDIVGRWPWPREVLARALENAYTFGAKVIAADVVWSEPTDRPEVRLVENVDRAAPLPAVIKSQFERKLTETDSDILFSQFIARHKKNFVLGNFYSDTDIQGPDDEADGYQASCHDIVLKNSPFSKMVESEATPIVAVDSAEQILPEEFVQLYQQKFADMEAEIRKSEPPPQNSNERYQLDQKILQSKLTFCARDFLNLKEDKVTGRKADDVAMAISENWPQIREVVKSISAKSFEEWLGSFKNRNLFNQVPETTNWTINIPMISTQSQAHGYFNAMLDKDGTIRRSQLITRTGSQYMPSIALQAYLVGTGQHLDLKIEPNEKLAEVKGIKKFTMDNDDGEALFDVPVSYEGAMTINYAGRQHMVPHASIADLLSENKKTVTVTTWNEKARRDDKKEILKGDFFKDKILVLGATAIGVFDLRVTPFDENFPGVETHANVIDNLLRRDFFKQNKKEDMLMPLVMLAIGFIISIALSRFGALYGLIFAFLIGAAILFIDKHFLFGRGILVSSGLPMAQVFLTYMTLTTYKYFTEERSKKELRGTFSKYVSPAIVEEILKDPKNLELGGRKERITVFFSDVRGFTTISEKLDPRALSDLLNSYLTPMTDLVFKNKGTLDKYMGDAVMAFFGAPIHYPDHAKHACRCALQSLEKLKELQADYVRKGLPVIDIGIGLNTGECSVGNMGSQTVRSYTVMGDPVNLASRLEGINKEYGTRIIISENTYKEIKDDFVCREVDWVRVKGKLQPVKIYELISEGKPADNIVDMSKYFSEGYLQYHEKQFSKAIELFEKALTCQAEDPPSQLYIERCQEFIAEPPPENWDGVYVMKTK